MATTSTNQICVLHIETSDCKNFIYLSEERFARICEIRDKRLKQPIDSPARMQEVCNQIPEKVEKNHGYHRDCYQRFSANLKRLIDSEGSNNDTKPKRARRSSKDQVLFCPDCIFCNKVGRKKVKIKGTWTTEGTLSFAQGGGDKILDLAENRGDENLARRIRGFDLFACEAQYHKSCRMKYSDARKWRSSCESASVIQKNLEETHDECFIKLCEVIDHKIIQKKEIMKLKDLRDIYVEYLSATEFSNPNYRSENLKLKLMKHDIYGNNLSFVPLDRKGGKIQSHLVFNREMELSSAVKRAYELGSGDKALDTAESLHRSVVDAFSNAPDLPWPPTATVLKHDINPVPHCLASFLQCLIGGSNTATCTSDKTDRLVLSIGQDLCRAITNGKWKLPKHILLCMTLRHLFRSAELNILMNRLGHSESYSYSLELETALAEAVEQSSSVLTPQIIRNPDVPSVFHSDFDNFDKLVNDLTGSGSVHTAHGIMMQTFSGNVNIPEPKVPSIERTGVRSLQTLANESLPPSYLSKSHRVSPKMTINRTAFPGNEQAKTESHKINLAWLASRIVSDSSKDKCVPAWAGFISETGKKPVRLTTIDYYPVINHPITEYATVKECLKLSEDGSTEVGQDYVITTFDLGVCMKAYPLVWKYQESYKNHIVMIGTFHIACAYMKMIGKKMDGSGLAEILTEAGLMSSGSMKGVLTGKNYSRAIYCHKALLEGLEKMLFSTFCESQRCSLDNLPVTSRRKLERIVEDRSPKYLEELMEDDEFGKFIQSWDAFRDSIRNGSLGKTAKFILSYMDHVWLVLHLLKSVKVNDFALYSYCIYHMADLFFSYDGQNYSRYLTYFGVFLANIDVTHPGALELLKLGAISVARSFVPGNLCAVDKTIEETFMKHAKSRAGAGGKGAGAMGILTNYSAYKRWARTAHERSRYLEVTLKMADMSTDETIGNKHRDTRTSEIKRSHHNAAKVVDAVGSFLNPFQLETENLVCIKSGAAVNDKSIEKDIMEAESIGKTQKNEFINQRLKKNKDFFEPIKRQRLRTFANISKIARVKNSKNREVELKQQGNIAFQLLVKSQELPEKLDLVQLMGYPLTPVPSSIGTADGYLLKTDKSKGFHHLTKDICDAKTPVDKETLYIEDGNAVFYMMTDVPSTFKQISEKLFDLSTSGKSNLVFSTDMYKETSIKTMERKSRGCGDKRLIQGENMKRPENWKEFLSNDDNKKQLIQIILKVWSNYTVMGSKLREKSIVFICEETAYKIEMSENCTSLDVTSIPELSSDQEETDTRVILYCKYAADNNFKYACIHSPDTDIFFILMHYASSLNVTLLFDTGTGNNRRLFDVSKLANELTPEFCKALLALHAYTRCDTTSAFKGIGKVKPIKLLQKKTEFVSTFSGVGENWVVSENLFLELEYFTCLMYKNTCGITEVDKLRYDMLWQKCGRQAPDPARTVELSALPPPRRCLREHIKRVNYQVAVWKRSHVPMPDIPSPIDGHGWHLVNNTIEPIWCDGEIIPVDLVDLLENENTQSDSDDPETENEESSDSEEENSTDEQSTSDGSEFESD